MERRSLLHGLYATAVSRLTEPNFVTCKTSVKDEVARVLDLIKQIRPGDLRKSLDQEWKPDGGLQVTSPTRYLLRSCDTIKVDVDFRQVDVTHPFDNPDDIITHVSKPYLEYPAYD